MKKELLIAILIISVVAALMGSGTFAVFHDTETITGSTFTAGILDLEINGENDPVSFHFEADLMQPGHTYNAGIVTVSNVGNVPGVLSVEVGNLVSDENGLYEPEISDGDTAGTEFDPTGYDANSGDGELWDQITVAIWIEGLTYGGAGSHNNNGQMDWDDTKLKSFSSTQDDYSSTYSIKLNTDLAAGKNIVLQPGESVTLGVMVKFIDDESNSWWGGQDGLTNNMALSDTASMDIIVGLTQLP